MIANRPFPIHCKKCGEVDGWPFQARSVEQYIVVDLRCRSCSHEWTESIPTLTAMSRTPWIERRKVPREPVTKAR
ncbi:MAG TPA: hypothetical protein VM096_16235 [Vicinamibacterales bacterium]|nr:hypothetical protein [Vicinamibacterales bacterium]